MKKLIIFFVILTLLANISIATDFYNNEEVSLNLSISGEINIHPNVNNYRIEYIKAYFFFFPTETWRQHIISSKIEPEAQIIEDSLNFEWTDVEEEKLNFKTNYKIKINEQLKKIKSKVNFPIKDLPEEYIQYTKPSENIDSSNPEIIKLASSLAEGEDDLFIVTNKLASWVEDNIKYSLNTLTEEASQKSSWVLLNRFGVCDELTSLFIALTRSLGIPARFISGVAYTDWNNINNWGPHAWAEVYFPGYGWVPFDITYKQFGFIDFSHINLMQNLDSDQPSTKYEWKAYGILLESKDLDIKVNLIEKKEKIDPLISLKTNLFEENIGFGSYNLVEAEIKNLKDYYVSTELYFSAPKEIELASKSKKHIVLKPNEIKKEYWLIKIEKNLDEKYAYTFPIGVNSLRNISSIVLFSSSKDDTVYSRTEMQEILDQKEKETEKIYSKNVELDCNAKKEYYLDEPIIINCYVKNIGNTVLNNLNLCLGKQCKKFELGISQSIENNFSIDVSDVEKKENIITIENNEVSKLVKVSYSVIDKPKIEIRALEHPDSVSYNDQYIIKFTVVKTSNSVPKDIIVDFKGKNIFRTWRLKGLSNEQEFVLDLLGKDLNVGKNGFQISVTYQDIDGNDYTTREDFYITLSKVNLIQRIIIFFRNLLS